MVTEGLPQAVMLVITRRFLGFARVEPGCVTPQTGASHGAVLGAVTFRFQPHELYPGFDEQDMMAGSS
jgi:hypothetical protein